jgi:type VI secretion system protein ImpF
MPSEYPAALVPSVLDRLMDPRTGGAYSLTQTLAVLRRDLEDLLNTRQPADRAVEDYPELRRSVFNFGTPDLAGRPIEAQRDREEVGRLLEEAIRRFEPRLDQIRATGAEPKPNEVRALRFLIDGRLQIQSVPRVEFATFLELSGHTIVEPPGR